MIRFSKGEKELSPIVLPKVQSYLLLWLLQQFSHASKGSNASQPQLNMPLSDARRLVHNKKVWLGGLKNRRKAVEGQISDLVWRIALTGCHQKINYPSRMIHFKNSEPLRTMRHLGWMANLPKRCWTDALITCQWSSTRQNVPFTDVWVSERRDKTTCCTAWPAEFLCIMFVTTPTVTDWGILLRISIGWSKSVWS